ncbi:hypothetical protein [Metapseudomonas furukawaii]|jgi:predicted transcriptional regulator|uniref:Uncharacterized protein n=1 Tax=Metapseudomonas furukawaii TaxID=1149133 RepID=A0AAD1FF18_METFU|nr:MULTISPECIES: hypothetical protein [Pseudomonas]ELS26662.1 hypothetical protein ppKF707_3080 [Pseudomonas furukawaii]BAU74380.1 hypothetical protein KF707C_26920 [Pseudomonas furukawaii]
MSREPLNLPDDYRRESWQIAETHRAIAEADEGDFATAEEVNATLDRWTDSL